MSHLRIAVVAVALLTAMAVAAWIGRRERAGIVLLVLLAVVWLSSDQEFEGPVLLSVSHTHGLVLTDLVSVAAMCIAAWLFRRAR